MRAFYISAVMALVFLANVGCQNSMMPVQSESSERLFSVPGAKNGSTVTLQSSQAAEPPLSASPNAGHN